MPVPRAQLGGAFGSGMTITGSRAPDYGAMIEGAVSGASTLLHNMAAQKLAERHLALQEAQQRAADEERRQAQADRAASTAFNQDQAQQRLEILRRSAAAAAAPKRHYDANRGGFVSDDGSFTPVQGLPPLAAKEGTPHYDAARGVFVHPDGTVTKVQGLPAPQETPGQRRAADAASRAADAALLREKNATVGAAKGDLDEVVRASPRPSTVPATVKGGLGTDAQGRTIMTPARPNPARLQATQDSLAYDAAEVKPARLRYRRAVDALVPSASTPAPAPAAASPAPRLRAPAAAPGKLVLSPAQKALAKTDAGFAQHLQGLGYAPADWQHE